MRWPFGRESSERARPYPPPWFELGPGDLVEAGRRRPDAVRAVAIYETAVAHAEPGDARRFALLWLGRDDDPAAVMVDRDVYGGEDAFDVETLHDLERVDPGGFGALTGLLTTGEEVSVTAPDGREVAGEGEPATLVRAGGADAASCPASGWAVNLFRTGTRDVMRFWLVLLDDRQVPRVAFRARTRRPRTATW